MSITINGSGTVTGISATGISAQPAFPGNILQVVNATYSTTASSSSTSYTDTGLTASITPSSSSSKILVLVNQTGCSKSFSNTYLRLILLRGASTLATFENSAGFTNTTAFTFIGACSICYLDSPATTSSTTYKTQFSSAAGASVAVNDSNVTSTITLMEVAA